MEILLLLLRRLETEASKLSHQHEIEGDLAKAARYNDLRASAEMALLGWNNLCTAGLTPPKVELDLVPKWRVDALVQYSRIQDKRIMQLVEELNDVRLYEQKEVWFWQGDGENYPASLNCPVVIHANDLNAILAKVVK